MITDLQTNVVYFSNSLTKEFPNEFNELKKIIDDAGYSVKVLDGTKDFYCRDFMPVQISSTDFVQFIFRPKEYLKGKQLNYLSNPIYVELMSKIPQPRYSPIILDGGNIIKWENKVIITDRVLKDNRYQFQNDEAIIERLKFDLNCEVILIPEYPKEKTGHADGLVRFIDSNSVFINDLENDPEKMWQYKFSQVLKTHKLQYKELPCELDEKKKTAEGLYINYLHLGNLIVVPQFGMEPSDNMALSTFDEVFGKTHQVVPFKANWIAENGGVFNCASWTVKD
ncbi:MAG: agmatine deiminase family protein [Salinivirgaceae bacterium]|jgi:agmatine deiminase